MSSWASLHLSCDFIIKWLHITLSSKSFFFAVAAAASQLSSQKRCCAGRYFASKKAALPLFAVGRKKLKKAAEKTATLNSAAVPTLKSASATTQQRHLC